MLAVFRKLYDFANKHWRVFALIGSGLWTLVGGVVTAWATWAAGAFSSYAPLSWVCAGLLGALVAAGILALAGVIRLKFAEAAVLDFAKKAPTTVNRLRNHFERESINLADFWTPFGQTRHYKNIAFRECDIFGPGSITIWHNTSVSGCNFIGCDLICVRNQGISTAILFESAVFDRCRFINISLFLAENVAVAFIEDMDRQGMPRPIIIGYDVPKT